MIMKLIIEGSESKLKRFAKENKLRFKRDKLTATVKAGKVVKTENDSDGKEHHKTVVANINAATELVQLEQFKDDDRASIKKALEAKILELTKDK